MSASRTNPGLTSGLSPSPSTDYAAIETQSETDDQYDGHDSDMEYTPGLNDEPDEDEDDEDYAPAAEEDEEEYFTVEDDEDEDSEGTSSRERDTSTDPIIVPRETIMRALNIVGLRELMAARGLRHRSRQVPPFDDEPSKAGQELMRSGLFGYGEQRNHQIKRSKKLARQFLEREMGSLKYGMERADLAMVKQDMIPRSKADSVIEYEDRCYSGQFSDDGNFFFSCCKDFRVRLYDTSNPYDWKYFKSVAMDDRSWTITDGSLSNDNKWLAYCSLNPIVCLASSDPMSNAPATNLDFSRLYGRSQRYDRYFAIYSVRFSRDGTELVAGTGGRNSPEKCIYVFDIERNQSILRIDGHDDDVNAVCFGDNNSPHILYSGSDDGTIKVWDRRSIGDGRPSGVFLGHTDGLTYVDSKGDGRYVLSNSKDQTTKLWDLRKVLSPEEAKGADTSSFMSGGWHFSSDSYTRHRPRPHSHDCSVVTFRGHLIERTLIRCHFSPSGSTDSRYVYSGSSDGYIYVWNLDATEKAKINVKSSTKYLKNRERVYDAYWGDTSGGALRTIIRDCSWHPDVPIIAATSWNGWDGNQGTCTVHSWKEAIGDEEPETDIFDAELEPISDT